MTQHNKKILIVDDRFEIRELIYASLETGPYKLFTASNDTETLNIARREVPDLILLDIQLVGSQLDGLAICKQLKSEPLTQHTTIVMLTAEGQSWDEQASYAAGADGYLVKPFSPIKLRRQVKWWLQGKPT